MLKARFMTRVLVALSSASFLGCSSSSSSISPDGGGGGSAGSGGSGGGAPEVSSSDLQPDSPGNTSPDTGGSGDTAEAGGSGSCAGYTLCDDFEGAAPGDAASAWTFIKKGAYTIQVDTAQAHSGTHSIHATATAAAGYAYIQETKTFPATDFWVRAYLRLQALGGHEVYVGADTALDEGTGDQVRYLNNLGGAKIATNRRAGDRSVTSATAIPQGSWDCYEWHQAPDGVHVFFNGKAITDADWLGAQPTFVALVFGIERFGGGMAGDVWIDDVAINSAQVGCN